MLFQELDKDRKRAQLILQHIPHVVPHKNVSCPSRVASGSSSIGHPTHGGGVFLIQAASC